MMANPNERNGTDETDWREALKPKPDEVLFLRDLSDLEKRSSESLHGDVLVDRPFYMRWEPKYKGTGRVYQEKD